jgi:predicted nucleotidyltransferase
METHSVETIVRALNAAGAQYLIVGGLAVNAHGFVRLTRDVDIVLGLERENARIGLDALLRAGWRLAIPEKPEAFADAATRERWRTEKNMIVLKLWSDEHQRTPVDIFIYEPFDFASEFSRADRLEICPGVQAPVVTLETLLQMKRAAGRPQDLTDIEELQRAR